MRKAILYTILSMVLLYSVSGQTVSITNPANNGNVVGTYMLNASITNMCITELCNVTYYVYSALSANTTLLYNVSDFVDLNQTDEFPNLTFDSTIFEDSADYTFNVTVRNTTDVISNSSTFVTIDNTATTAPNTTSPSDQTITGDISPTFSATVAGYRVTNCTLNFRQTSPYSTNTSISMTHTGDSCTYTQDSATTGTYTWYIQVSDGTNTSDTSDLQLSITELSGGGGGGTAQQIAVCTPDWNCGSWSDCSDDRQQRICTDRNGCLTDASKPDESRECTTVTEQVQLPDVDVDGFLEGNTKIIVGLTVLGIGFSVLFLIFARMTGIIKL